MNELLAWLAVMTLIASGFVVWPLLGSRRKKAAAVQQQITQRQQANERLYNEQLAEIQKDFANGVIDTLQQTKLMADLNKIHNSDVSERSNQAATAQLSSSKSVGIATAVIVPLAAVIIYFLIGAAPDWEINRLDRELSEYVQANTFDDKAETMLNDLQSKLQRRLKTHPDNVRNWYLLANVAFDKGDVQGAIDAYTKILEQNPNTPGVLSQMVQVLYVAAGNKFTQETRSLFERALRAEPQNHGLLMLGGLDAFETERFGEAVSYWMQALRMMAAGDPRREQLMAFIQQARVKQTVAGQSASPANDPAPTQHAQDDSNKFVDLQVSLAEQVDAKPSDRVFIYARAWQGPPMPLSIADLTVADLPTTVRLDNSRSMIEGMTLDRFPQIELVARISSTGQNTARSGEWEATQGPVSLVEGGNKVALVIEKRRP